MDELVSALCQSLMGPGFESQVPQYICVFFLQAIACDLQSVGPPYSSSHQTPDGFRSNPGAKIEWPSCTLVKRAMGNWKSKPRPAPVGPWKYYPHTQIRPSTPHIWLFLFIFHFFILFLLIIIIIILTNLFFLIKIRKQKI